jgi:hypothetical protein
VSQCFTDARINIVSVCRKDQQWHACAAHPHISRRGPLQNFRLYQCVPLPWCQVSCWTWAFPCPHGSLQYKRYSTSRASNAGMSRSIQRWHE